MLSEKQMTFLMTGIALTLFLCLPTYAQSTKTRQKSTSVLPCALELKDAPTIRGIRLGMPVNEFLKMFPSATERDNSRPEVGAKHLSKSNVIF